ncbi:unnamed protein product [Vitrella brassicaformis CCMP3155]|uniref:Uncharacterized protein n=1 Tax=Vitrella brassicaformis (strain CCMP3155) TaxID=1169540 RepID=A0A0G4GAT1_VITBC|nr:unnamed protein product [Vitrella brassicaformis CCMP3155]|eukprot:CEM25907.1 unnamed protein product [Vitrella brassicaformis CCMP3155]
MGAVNSKSTDKASPAINGQVLDVVYRDERDELHNVKDLGHIRRSAMFFSKVDFPAQILRSRLNRSLHRIRLADGTRLDVVLAFDAQTVSEPRELLAAIWMVEEQRWDEVAEVLQLASQCGCCTLPLNLTADDINTHPNKTAYGSVARVLAQLMVVGRHIDFGYGTRLQIFRHGNGEVRAIKDEPGFRLDVDPPLAAGHLYQRHRLEYDPPVRSRIDYSGTAGEWVSFAGPYTDASVSSFAKRKIFRHFDRTHQINLTWIHLNRRVGGGRPPDAVAPHTMRVDVRRTEAAVCVSGSFKDRLPVTTQLARVALGRVAPYVFDGQVQQQQDDDSDDDDGDDMDEGDDDDMDEGSGGEGSGDEEEDAAADEESGDEGTASP